jgi:tetratricopeptide (TPR) repeat protein
LKFSRPVYLIFLVSSMLSEAIAVVAMIKGYPLYDSTAIAQVISFHTLAASLAGCSLYFKDDEARKMAGFAFIISLTIPLFGYGAITMIFSGARSRASSELFGEFQAHVTAGIGKVPPLSENVKKSLVMLKEGFEIEPLSSSISDANPRVKLNIIRSLGKLSSRDAIKMLKSLIIDPHMDVRYYAGEEIARIAEFLAILINKTRDAIAAHPDDYTLYRELGELHIRQALSGLFEEPSQGEELQSAQKALEKSLELKPDQFEGQLLMGRLYFIMKDYDRSITFLEEAVRIKPGDIPSLLSLSESYWEKRDFERLKPCVDALERDLKNYSGADRDQIALFIESWREQSARGEKS